MTTAAKGGRGEGQDSTSTGAGGAEVCCWGWPQCGELNGGGGHSQLQSSNPESSSGESAMCGAWVCVQPCFKEVTAVFFLRVTQGLLAEKTCFQAVCLSPSPAKQSRVESTCIYHTSHMAKEHCNHPACHTKQPRPKEPCTNLPSTGLAICGDLPQDSTPCKPAQWACHGNVPQRPVQSSLSRLGPWTCGQKTLDFPNNNGHTCTLSR